MARKGKIKYKQQPHSPREGYGEIKRSVHTLLTPTAIALLDERAEELGISRGELLERLARGLQAMAKLEQSDDDPP